MGVVNYWDPDKGSRQLQAQDIIDLGPFSTLSVTALTVTSLSATTVTVGYASQSVGADLTAAGSTRADALQLADAINQIGTAASGTGAILPDVAVGTTIDIYNDGASDLTVYALASGTIDGTAGATGVTLTAAARCSYTLIAADTWISALKGAVSA